jgi:hypothetical protein
MAFKIRPLVLALAGGLLGAAAVAVDLGCQRCTDDVCFSQARLIVGEPGGGPLRAGTYFIELTVDGEAVSTTCEVAAGAADVDCEALGEYPISAPLFDSPDNPHTQIWIDFSEPLPEAIELNVEHDGASVLATAFEFDYELSKPGCDAECRDALTELAFERE